MTIDTEKQFAGNYVRLVNKPRSLEQDVILRDKMLNLIAEAYDYNSFEPIGIIKVLARFKKEAQEELVAEQNKKAANCESI